MSARTNESIVIDASLVEKLIREQFPDWADLPVTPVKLSGWDNRTFHLGDACSVRLPSAAHYAKAVHLEQTWLPRLAPHLPLPIPEPLAMGEPSDLFPWHWSVYRWHEGEVASASSVPDQKKFARQLASFLRALQSIDTRDGPVRKLRGGSLELWQEQAETALDLLEGKVDTSAARDIWNRALGAPLNATQVWFHGDVAAGNLLMKEGELSAVIDFGGLGVGDPACDMVIAWTFLNASSRQIFREKLSVDDAIWDRGRGWALWKAMIVVTGMIETNAIEAASSQYALDQLLEDNNR